MSYTLDSIGLIGELSLATGSDLRFIYAYIDRDSDTCSCHSDSNANTNSYSPTFLNANPGTAWLS